MQLIVSSLSTKNHGAIFITPAMTRGHPGGTMLTGWPLNMYPLPIAKFLAMVVYTSLSPPGA